MKSSFVLFLTLLSSVPAHAAPAGAVHDRRGLDSIGNLVGNVRSFAQGAIRVAYVSTEEPASGSEHLLFFVAEEPMGLGCFAVSANADGRGFSSIDMRTTLTSEINRTMTSSASAFTPHMEMSNFCCFPGHGQMKLEQLEIAQLNTWPVVSL
jgi:hypothetical protein